MEEPKGETKVEIEFDYATEADEEPIKFESTGDQPSPLDELLKMEVLTMA